MALIGTVVATPYLVVGGLRTRSALFFAFAVLSTARIGGICAAAFEPVISRLTMQSRGTLLVMFATGGHLADTRYTVGSLFGSSCGHLVLGMLTLWFILTGLVEVGRVRARDGLAGKKVRMPVERAAPFYLGAVPVAILLLVGAGLLLN